MSERLAAYAQRLFNLRLSETQQAQFVQYAAELEAWNKSRANLTAITGVEAIEIRHFLDSLSLLSALDIPQGARLIDVGTGGGFPGVPLKIVRPDLRLTLLEATSKKIAFLQHLAGVLRLSDVQFLNARAEEAGHMPDQRECYDFVVARAVAHMPILAEYLLPLARVGGLCVAMKGESAEREAGEAANALRILGGRVSRIVPVTLPEVAELHYLVIIEKIAPTPHAYPRKPGLPAKKPL
ncbi:MAG: 16S rRNA (guanine(527)-N(7))-methyltransferase RsmG [Candidatus Thermofonsia Clade 1 bacterium]|uniref:Ribosomal RNA small subunit methyltransferase G n=1 Tax=Candidatus Thermofonsia Clade 1 bacterium TaxID=2364210 RepID=A0A2M8NYV4_9CHLR|nr:MAG: 16S rRNA (guanine(527)-N(7))-methyltransferase RsmG [Candidatus Thermofonsia Clade 1 bacterium]